MTDRRLEKLSDLATDAHARMQQDFEHINPVIGLSTNMRSKGFPADVMTIDCLTDRKRIVLILNDNQPDIISYQFSLIDTDPTSELQVTSFDDFDSQKLYEWMSDYFSNSLS